MDKFAVDFPAEIERLKIGQSLNIGAVGYVKRKERNSYVLKDNSNPYRARWGTLAEIKEDVKFFTENGMLPKQDGPAW